MLLSNQKLYEIKIINELCIIFIVVTIKVTSQSVMFRASVESIPSPPPETLLPHIIMTINIVYSDIETYICPTLVLRINITIANFIVVFMEHHLRILLHLHYVFLGMDP